VPYLAVNMTVWGLISGTITDGSSTFIEAGAYLRQEALPKTSFVMRVLVRNLVAFAHNLLIVPIVYLIFMVVPSPIALLAIPGLALILVATFMSTLCLGLLCTRFRDLPQIVANMLQLAFFVTPIMWHAEQLGRGGDIMLLVNPFAALLRIVSEPMQGRIPALSTYGSVLVYLTLLFVATWPLFARFRARIVYWL
jgi:lipopolysaccharide transport system permease protein